MNTLTDSHIKDLPAPIVEKLQSLIGRVRRLLFLRGLFATIAAALASILVIMAIDASFTLFSDLARWALSLCGFAFTLGIAWHFLIHPLSKTLTLTHIARILETRHPELQERISSAVELMRSDDPDSIKGSQELIAEVVNSAVIDVKDVEPESEFDNSKTQRFFYVAVTTAAIVLILLAIWPRQTGILFARALAPFLDIGNAYSNTLTVDPGDIRVPIGESVTVRMSIQNRHIRRVTLRRSTEEAGSESVERMSLQETAEDGSQTFSMTFPAVAESFRYRINAGSAVSRYFTVEAVPLPGVESLSLRYDYPPYTGLESREVESNDGDISAVEHSQVTVKARLNKAAARAVLSINETLTPSEPVFDNENNQVSWRFPLNPGTTGTWKLNLTDENDFENRPATFAIHAVPDRTPEITITAPQIRELKLNRSETLPIKYNIKEDFGFSAIDLVVRRDSEADPQTISQPQPAPGGGGMQSWNGNAMLDISKLRLTDQTTKLTVQLRVRDNLPTNFDGPHEVSSDPITIILDINAQSLVKQAIEADRRELEQALAKAKTDLTQARAEANQAEQQLKRTDNLSPEATLELDQFREKAKDAHETLRDISEKMQRTAFDRQAKQVAELANDEVAKAREAADMIPLSDEKNERVEKAQEAGKEVEQALKEIAEISESLKKSQPEVQMIAQLNELAGDQRQLARQASEQARQMPPQPNEQDQKKLEQDFANWQQQQKKLQSQLGDILKENEAALQDVLERQQKQAEQLAMQAEQLAKEQQQVGQATEQATKEDGEKALRKQLLTNLAKEQKSIANDTKKLEDQLKNPPKDSKQKPNTGQKPAAAAQDPKLEMAVHSTAEAAKALEKEKLQQAMDAANEAAKALQTAQNLEKARSEQKNPHQDQPKPSGPQPESEQPDNKQTAQSEPAGKNQKQPEPSPDSADPSKMADATKKSPPAPAPSPTNQELGNLKDRQENIKRQLQSIHAGDLEEALTMQEEQLAKQAEQLAQHADALENDTQMAKQANAKNRAGQAESQLQAAKQQADRASQQLTQAKQAQERAEQAQRQETKEPAKTPMSPQTKQALSQSQSSQKQAEDRFKAAAKELQQAARELADQANKLSPEKMKSQALESKDLAESYQDVSKASDSKNNQQASDKAKKAADSLQQLAQAALEKLAGKGEQQNQSDEAGRDAEQMAEQKDSESKPQLSEGGRTPDMDGSGVPPELAKLGMTFADWARMKGTLQSGSSNQDGDSIPEEYRDLVQRYFKVIAAEATESK